MTIPILPAYYNELISTDQPFNWGLFLAVWFVGAVIAMFVIPVRGTKSTLLVSLGVGLGVGVIVGFLAPHMPFLN